jgi:plasmid stabilization system protein ParE
LTNIIDYIAIDSKQNARNIVKKIRENASNLNMMPEKGRIVPELDFYNIRTYREIIESPWRIIYRIEDNKVHILAVIDGRRNVEDVLLQRFLRF